MTDTPSIPDAADVGTFECGDVPLQKGVTLRKARIVYKTYGELSPAKDNVIVYPTSYSAQHSDIDWLVSPRHCLDPGRWFVIIPNMFCNGLSTSPSNFEDNIDFPHITAYDNVMQQHRLLTEVFGIQRIKMVYGWSMGAQQAYHWATLFPGMVERIVVNCGSARTSPHNYVFLEGVRMALQADPAWDGERLQSKPERGLRAMGRIYAGWAMSQTFYRQELWRAQGYGSLEDYLKRGWEENFLHRHARDLLAQLWTWQHADISDNGTFKGDLQAALASIEARVLLMPSATDLYFQAADNRIERMHLKNAVWAEIPSVWGHRAGNPKDNPEDAAFIDLNVRAFLSS